MATSIFREIIGASEEELVQAETVSFPFAALILILVFASLVAAGMPLVVAALAIPTTLAGVYLAAQATELSIYVQNVATMLGLALAIDYSLFLVSRFREELRRGRDVGTTVQITEVALLELPVRLAKALLRLAGAGDDAVATGVTRPVNLSQRELSNIVGATRESVNKCMREWHRSGAIRIDGTAITITDPAVLQAVADSADD